MYSGTVKFQPPEVHKETDFSATPALDIWALGIIMYMTLFNKFPFPGELSELPQQIIEN